MTRKDKDKSKHSKKTDHDIHFTDAGSVVLSMGTESQKPKKTKKTKIF